jgi:hypothetical protein
MQAMSPQEQSIEPTKEEKERERRFIAAIIHADKAVLSELYREGMGVAAVNARAAHLGLTSEVIKLCRLNGTLPATRTCVKCDVRFLSAGPQNRLCKRCPPR